jgi:hypothetical protein
MLENRDELIRYVARFRRNQATDQLETLLMT